MALFSAFVFRIETTHEKIHQSLCKIGMVAECIFNIVLAKWEADLTHITRISTQDRNFTT
ncbi:Uncharacterised protein [Vibrio cholerae]|nr:Uncharacterised protein [Vibrio cholerae]